jgi:hypothetical protein
MELKHYISALLVGILVIGCNSGSDKKSNNTPSKQQPTNAQYIGQHNGCVVYYDELFCNKKYKDGVLNASKETLYIRDENGSMVILDKNHTKVGSDYKIYEKVDLDEK